MNKRKISITIDEETYWTAREYCDRTGSKLSSIVDRMLACMFETDVERYKECRKWALSRHEDILKSMRQ